MIAKGESVGEEEEGRELPIAVGWLTRAELLKNKQQILTTKQYYRVRVIEQTFGCEALSGVMILVYPK